MDQQLSNLLGRQLNSMTEDEWEDMPEELWKLVLEKEDWDHDNRNGLVRSRYEVCISKMFGTCTLTDMTVEDSNTNENWRQFDADEYQSIVEWLGENNLGIELDHIDHFDDASTYGVFVRPQSKENDELLMKLRWW